MYRNTDGDKVFENHSEAMYLVRDWVSKISAWLEILQNEYGIALPMKPHYKSRLNDLGMVTQRYIAVCRERENELIEKIRQLSDDSLCPRCLGPRNPTP